MRLISLCHRPLIFILLRVDLPERIEDEISLTDAHRLIEQAKTNKKIANGHCRYDWPHIKRREHKLPAANPELG